VFVAEVLELAAKKCFERSDMGYKRNAKGEHVVAIIAGWRRD
jgi:hypothetical protein